MIAEADAQISGYRPGYDLTKNRAARDHNPNHDPISTLEQELGVEAAMPKKYAGRIPVSLDMTQLRELQETDNGHEQTEYDVTDVASSNGYHGSGGIDSIEFSKLFSQFIESLSITSPVQAKVMQIMYGEGVVRTLTETAEYAKMNVSAASQARKRAIAHLQEERWAERFAQFL